MGAKIVTSTENLPYEEWLEYRKWGIGGLDASVVCGINKYKTLIELWMEKVNNFQPQESGESPPTGERSSKALSERSLPSERALK